VSVPPYGGPAIPRCWRGTARLACFYEISYVDSNGGPAIRGARPSEQCSLSRTLSVRPHVAHRQKKRPAPGAFYLAERESARPLSRIISKLPVLLVLSLGDLPQSSVDVRHYPA